MSLISILIGLSMTAIVFADESSFRGDYFIDKPISDVASAYSRVMKNTVGCDPKMWAAEFGGKKQECYTAHKKGVGGNTLRSYIVVDGIVKRETHRYQDTSYDSRAYDYYSSLEKISHDTKPNFILENIQLRTAKRRNYYVSWEFADGFATANVECTLVFDGKKWIFPQKIRYCSVLQVQFTGSSKSLGITKDIRKKDAEY